MSQLSCSLLLPLLLLLALPTHLAASFQPLTVAPAVSWAEGDGIHHEEEDDDETEHENEEEHEEEVVTWLGVGVEETSEVLQKQLGLQSGFGLVVEFVEEDSPAAAAGLQQHDVLVSLGDQLLINPEQFVTLIRSEAPGTEVPLTLRRAGETLTLQARLASHVLEEEDHEEEEALARFHDWFERHPGMRFRVLKPDEAEEWGRHLDEETRERLQAQIEEQLHRLGEDGQLQGFHLRMGTPQAGQRSKQRLNLNGYDIEIEREDDETELSIESPEGEELFEGEPADLDLDEMPAEIRGTLRSLLEQYQDREGDDKAGVDEDMF